MQPPLGLKLQHYKLFLAIIAVLFKNNPFLTVPMQQFVETNHSLTVPIHFQTLKQLFIIVRS
jgi:hypothetical protein